MALQEEDWCSAGWHLPSPLPTINLCMLSGQGEHIQHSA